MKNMKEVRNESVSLYKDVKNGKINPNLAKVLYAGIGKVINTVNSQMAYARLRKEKVQIDFMKCK